MKNILFIYQNAYSQTGGIQAFNKNFISVLENIKEKSFLNNVELLSIYDDSKDISSNLKFTTLDKNKLSAFTFILQNYKRFDTFIFAHVNLAPLAFLLNIFNSKCKIIFITHGIDVWKKLPWTTEKIMNKSTILTVSNFSKNELLKYNPKLNNIVVFPNCIKLQNETKQLKNPYKQNEFNILSVTRLTKGEEFKGIDSMIKSLPLLIKFMPNIKYSVIGKGEDIFRLKQIAKSLDVEKYVNFLGFVDDINEYYQYCDIFALPSKKEGFGIVYLEAYQYKKPVIGCNFGGPTDVIIDGKTGFLCEYDDHSCISKKIKYLFQNPLELKNLGKNGYRRLMDNFTYEHYKNNLENILLGHSDE